MLKRHLTYFALYMQKNRNVHATHISKYVINLFIILWLRMLCVYETPFSSSHGAMLHFPVLPAVWSCQDD